MAREKGQPPPPGIVEAGEVEATQYPSEVEAFGKTLRASGVPEERIPAILDYCSQEDLRDLERLDLNLWDMGIANVHQRRRIIKYWARSTGLALPEELVVKYKEDSIKTVAGEEREKKRRVEEGRIWFVDKDVKGMPDLRLAKKDEEQLTMEEAKEAMKAMGGEEGGVVVYDEAQGRHVPNWSSPFVKSNPSVAWAAAHAQDKAMAEGKEQDPLDIMMATLARTEQIKMMVGSGTAAAEPRSTVGEIIQGMRELREMEGGRASGPEWTSDPMQFMQVIDAAVERRLPRVDEAAKEEARALRAEVQGLKDALIKAEMDKRDQQFTVLTNTVRELQDEINKPRAATGATAADIMGRLVDKIPGPGDLQRGFTEVARAVERGQQATPRTPEQRREDLDSMEQNLTEDNELTKFENYWRFGVK